MLESCIKLSHCQTVSIVKKNKQILTNKNTFKTYIQNLKSKNITVENLCAEKLQILNDNIDVINYHSSEYPICFKEIPDPPLVFYATGNLRLLQKPKVAIVGSRTPSMNNMYLAGELAKFLSSYGITIVSGFARGIDTAAHKNALDNTIAVLGTGFNKIYPRENYQLYDQLKNKGLVISEFPLNTLPLKYNFPRRNRLISALADIVIIIEAKERSGSLITARLALDYNKDVFAVPGHPLDYRVKGSNMLIRDGAYLLSDFDDILDMLHRKYPYNFDNIIQESSVVNDSSERKQSKSDNDILNLLSDISLDPEEIASQLEMSCAELNKCLSKLELSDKIYIDAAGKICRKYRN